MSLKMVYKILEEVSELVAKRATKISYKRVYIPKKINADGTIPLEKGKMTLHKTPRST